MSMYLSGGSRPAPDRPVGSRVLAHTSARLLLFARWLTALDVMFMVGVWFIYGAVAPEPSTLFFGEGSLFTEGLRPVWLTRGVVPTLFAGFIFYRAVLGWKASWALAGSLLLCPVAVLLSVLWSRVFSSSGVIIWVAYGR